VWTDKSEKASFDLISLEGEEIKLGQNTFYCLTKEQAQNHNVVKIRKMNQTLDTSKFTHTLQESR
jgi:hypothetical protein